jgi:hypothetical protein
MYCKEFQISLYTSRKFLSGKWQYWNKLRRYELLLCVFFSFFTGGKSSEHEKLL